MSGVMTSLDRGKSVTGKIPEERLPISLLASPPTKTLGQHWPDAIDRAKMGPCHRFRSAMRVPAVLVLVLVLASALAASDATAQFPGGMPTLSPAELAEANDACDRLAGIPNAPMSVQSCKAMLGMAGTAEGLRSPAAGPSARRPGDEHLSCEAIFAEMTTLGGDVLSDAGASQADAAVAEGTALGQRHAGEMKAFMAGTFALGAAMGAASVVMPGFAVAAIAAAWATSAAAMGTKQTAEHAALRPRRDEAIIASAENFERAMSANPRFARLTELAMGRECKAPDGVAR